ncbi:hypothetical protein SAMN04490355_105231 [Pelosinus propionicus DSM 13327]|uniref:Uncharacterized protein n=1 Tax=Pelosinus propionicus DSM 13327 TaxID=1123291 RepID=A0A1I4NUN0_9FIRM|nr:hypothetical protein SAMN04490355_105231 [Pelosinus propionicus DSM 13327]
MDFHLHDGIEIYLSVSGEEPFEASNIRLIDSFYSLNIESNNKMNLSDEENNYLVNLFDKILNINSKVGKELPQRGIP